MLLAASPPSLSVSLSLSLFSDSFDPIPSPHCGLFTSVHGNSTATARVRCLRYLKVDVTVAPFWHFPWQNLEQLRIYVSKPSMFHLSVAVFLQNPRTSPFIPCLCGRFADKHVNTRGFPKLLRGKRMRRSRSCLKQRCWSNPVQEKPFSKWIEFLSKSRPRKRNNGPTEGRAKHKRSEVQLGSLTLGAQLGPGSARCGPPERQGMLNHLNERVTRFILFYLVLSSFVLY